VAHPNWHDARNILCIRLDNMGDVLMSTPAIRALKQSRPGRRITLLASSSGAHIAALIPEIDHTIIYDAPWNKATAPRANSQPEQSMIDTLREQQFDAAVIFTVYSQNPLPAAFLCFMADIPLRLAHCHENPYQLLTDWIEDPEPAQGIRHEVQRQLDLVAATGAHTKDVRLSLRVPPAARAAVRQRLSALGLGAGQPWAVIHAGASAPSRRYPGPQFAEVAACLASTHGIATLFTGTAAEAPLVDDIRAAIPESARRRTHSLAGPPSGNGLSLAELAALIEMAPVIISNNSGPAHIAAATGTPIVDLYALTNPQHTPWRVQHRVLFHDVLCKYCYKSTCPEGHHNCLRLVSPQSVVDAALALLREQRKKEPYEHEPITS
jgi:lipopolysaccharide heptosyltransferase II